MPVYKEPQLACKNDKKPPVTEIKQALGAELCSKEEHLFISDKLEKVSREEVGRARGGVQGLLVRNEKVGARSMDQKRGI